MEKLTLHGGVMTVTKEKPIMVVPESETPGGFYYLSSMDQAIPITTDTIYSYERYDETTFDAMRKALAKILAPYYPLTGKLAISPEGRFVVELTKQGVPFVVAEADVAIADLGDIRVPNQDTSNKLLYRDPSAKNLLDVPLLSVQVTKFKCGGFTLGIIISHCMVDGVSAMNFYKGWAEITKGLTPSVTPDHDRTILKARDPPQPKYPYNDYVQIVDSSNMEELYEKEPMVSKIVTIESSQLAALKKKVLAEGTIKNCSTFAVAAALLWRARNEALGMRPNQMTKLLIMIDIRTRLSKPISHEYFGSTVTHTGCLAIAGELAERPLSYAVQMVTDAVEAVNDDFVRSRLDFVEKYRPPLHATGTLVVSAWTRLDYSTADFGCGEPTQFACAGVAKELCVLLPHGEDKRGIGAVVALPPSVMDKFEKLLQQA